MNGPKGSVSVGCLALAAAVMAVSWTGIAAADARLGTQVVPKSQAITLRIDADQLHYTGSVEIELDVREATKSFTFHSEGPTIETLTLTQGGQSVPVEFEAIEHERIEVHTAEPLTPGAAVLKIAFSNTLDTTNNSLYRIEVDGDGYTFTQFEADDAREAFPCWDEPAFKIPFRMTISVPENHVAVFNTPVLSENTTDGWTTYVFEELPPIPAYLLALATGQLEWVEIPGMSVPGRVITIKGKTHLTGETVAMTPPILAALEKYFGSKYPYAKCDLIAVPGKGGAMENPGLITYGDGLLLLDPETISPSQRRSLAAVNAHELAHIWFGDYVTLEWWDDTWLNESFASWMGDKITHEVFPEFGMDVTQVRSAQRAMLTDARPSTRAIRRPVEATDNLAMSFDALAYSKGQAVLGMFEQWLGEDVLRRGVLDYLDQHAWGTATAHDFWDALSAASGQDIEKAMSTFLDQGGVPLVTAEVTLDNHVKLRQKRFSNYGVAPPDEGLWSIPVVLKYFDGIEVKTQTVLLDEAEKTVPLYSLEGDLAWVLPNSGMHGYYRWSVPPDMLARMAEQASETLETRERVGLIGNLSAELDAGTMRGDDYLRTLKHFADDPDPQVVSALLSALGKIRNAFVTDDNEDEFAAYVRETLGPALERFSLARKDGEAETVTRFRSQLIGWLGDEGKDAHVQAYADSLAGLYLTDATAVDPQIAGVCLSLAAHRWDRTMFDECRTRFESAQVPRERSRFLRLLGDFREPELVDEALRYSLEGPLRAMEIFSIPGGISGDRKNEDMIYEWLTANYDRVTSRIPPQYAAFMPFVARGCSAERLEKAKVFFAEPEHNVPGTDEQLAKLSDRVTDCVGLRNREGSAVGSYLAEFATTE